jgi:uncharacterized tellurite resistance protein B-like protein
MDSLQNLYYAIGEMAYAMAAVDGKVQREERDKFFQLVASELKNNEHNFDISEIVFRLMDKEKQDSETVYNWGMKQIKLNSHYLSPALKQKFVRVMEKVAEAYPPVTSEESSLLERFKEDIEQIHGDPVFFE